MVYFEGKLTSVPKSAEQQVRDRTEDDDGKNLLIDDIGQVFCWIGNHMQMEFQIDWQRPVRGEDERKELNV